MKKINKRDIVLICVIFIIVIAVTIIMIIPKNNTIKNEMTNQTNTGSYKTNNPEELLYNIPSRDEPLKVPEEIKRNATKN